MKNLLTVFFVAFSLISCSDKKATEAVQPEQESNVMLEEPKPIDSAVLAAKVATEAGVDPSVIEGKTLVEGADCLACHKIDAKLVGPSYQDVAAKYTEADINQLATKIIQSRKGVWGEIPMTAHAGLSEENAHKMVKYKKKKKK